MNFQQHMYTVDGVKVSRNNTMIQHDKAIIIYVAEGEVEAIVDRRTFHLVSDFLLVIQARKQIQIKHGEYTLVRF
ncbi:hypothetical protein [Virgibacillus proomii]|uniref:hypothetical protein n=1 Tax=Virgibacillus proomii TaxID=84407 RepID=UPI001C0FA470|nr:hypothetical protein [Virgibacillus proomii]MBU5267547.1 hypothetical protein [Virgibacillus proomii]